MEIIDSVEISPGKWVKKTPKTAAQANITGDGRGTVDKDNPISGLAKGYYVLVDVTDLTAEDFKNDTAALNVVKVVNNIEALAIKHGTTQDEKTIVADTLGKDSGENTYTPGEDKDNVSVGDTVRYNIAATVPSNADKFAAGTFFFVITDKLSDGLTMVETGEEGNKKPDIEVYNGTTLLTEGTHYTVKYPGSNGNTFEIGLINAASYKGQTINVKYSAILNENAVIGEEGNPNTSTVQFSNNPNQTYDGDPEDQNYPGFPDSEKHVPTGETPVTETRTYTTGIEIQKVDQDGKPLQGATFELSGTSTKTVLTVAESFTAAADGDYYKLKNGKYTKEAPSTETTMKEAEAGATAGYVEDAEATGDDVITVGGKKYRPYVPETDSGKTIYIKVEGNADQYESEKYKKTVTKTANDVKTEHKIALAVDENGLVRFDGLGAGTYTIKETVTPGGYNTVADQTVTITFTEDGTPKWSFSGNGAYDQGEGIYKIEIENNKGTQLPETGGIGTTIFYIVGAILVIGAGILLVTRRRMNAN